MKLQRQNVTDPNLRKLKEMVALMEELLDNGKNASLIHNILHEFNHRFLAGNTIGDWDEDFSSEWREILGQLPIRKRLYAA